MNRTTIDWTDYTWNPTTGCSKVSPGCEHCYAEAIARRFAGTSAFPSGFRVATHPDRLRAPWKRVVPSLVFVDSMGDLFHPDVPREFIQAVFESMCESCWHVYQILTKRPREMADFLSRAEVKLLRMSPTAWSDRPPDWIWLGVSVEDQERALERIPALLRTPAAVRFVSCEPLLGPIDLGPWLEGTLICQHCGRRFATGDLTQVVYHEQVPHRPVAPVEFSGARPMNPLDWAIVGAETGPGARPCDPEWVRAIVDQCRAAGVPVWVKDNVGWPERVQEMPRMEHAAVCWHVTGRRRAEG